MNIAALIIQLLTGAVGGNVVGKLVKKIDMGTLWNSILGVIGGGLGGQILSQLGLQAGPSGALDIESILKSVASGGTGGGALMAIVSIVKTALAGKKK